MTRAYSESYLNNAKERLAAYFDYMVNDCGLHPDWAATLFTSTGFGQQFERGNPAYVSGMSGIELARTILLKAYGNYDLPEATLSEERSPEYWTGWALAEYQWFTGRRFRDIFERVPVSVILQMYQVYHEMDITAFITALEAHYEAARGDAPLKRIRENRALSQSELAELSGVKLRSIQAYEQRDHNIDKAQGQTLYKLSRVLGCDMEDLLENPMA